jgi:hypothetical protein
LARQGTPGVGPLAPLVARSIEGTLVVDARPRVSQQFSEMLCRLDRERLDCVVVKTHFERALQGRVPPQ